MFTKKKVAKDIDWESQLHTKLSKQWRNLKQADFSIFLLFVILSVYFQLTVCQHVSKLYLKYVFYLTASDAKTGIK